MFVFESTTARRDGSFKKQWFIKVMFVDINKRDIISIFFCHHSAYNHDFYLCHHCSGYICLTHLSSRHSTWIYLFYFFLFYPERNNKYTCYKGTSKSSLHLPQIKYIFLCHYIAHINPLDDCNKSIEVFRHWHLKIYRLNWIELDLNTKVNSLKIIIDFQLP